MDKNTLSNYGWIVIAVLVLSVMIALATPFGEYIKAGVESTTAGLFETSEKAMNVVGMSATGQPLIKNQAQTSSVDWKTSSVLTSIGDIVEKEGERCFISNAIPVKKGDVLRIKGSFDTSATSTMSNIILGVYKDESALKENQVYVPRLLTRPYSNAVQNGVLEVVNVIDDPVDSNYKTYEYTFGMHYNGKYHTNIKDDVQYWVRFSGSFNPGCIDDVIITVNEKIVSTVKEGSRWYAFGDSISEGYYSYLDAEGNAKYTLGSNSAGWVYKVADTKKLSVTNYSVGGSGYVLGDTRTIVGNTDFSQCDIVTLAFGVNDWKGKATLGTMNDDASVNSMVGNMRYIIEKIKSDNSSCKIIVITPINSSSFGTAETNWGLNYSGNNTSGPGLEQIYQLQKQVCDYYNVKLVDMTHSTIITNDNIFDLLLDRLHPTKEAHTLMANELANYIK